MSKVNICCFCCLSDDSTQVMLKERRDQYRHAAVVAKKAGDIPTASKYLKTAKVKHGKRRAVCL